jgi:hypothetical protein
MKLELICNKQFTVEELAPIGHRILFLHGKNATITGYAKCDTKERLCDGAAKGNCTVNFMRVLDSLGHSWCLDGSELKNFKIDGKDII